MDAHERERLGTALTRMARELADSRRQILVLRRENAALKARLGDEPTGRPTTNGTGAPRTPRVGVNLRGARGV
jgi:hypothetical protein